MIAAEWRQPREALFHGSVVSEVSRCPPGQLVRPLWVVAQRRVAGGDDVRLASAIQPGERFGGLAVKVQP
jgi:hypothetical protein